MDKYYKVIPTEKGLALADKDGNIVPGQLNVSVDSGHDRVCEATVTLIVKPENNHGKQTK